MAYKEEHFDSAGAKAISRALAAGNDAVIRKSKAQSTAKRKPAKKSK